MSGVPPIPPPASLHRLSALHAPSRQQRRRTPGAALQTVPTKYPARVQKGGVLVKDSNERFRLTVLEEFQSGNRAGVYRAQETYIDGSSVVGRSPVVVKLQDGISTDREIASYMRLRQYSQIHPYIVHMEDQPRGPLQLSAASAAAPGAVLLEEKTFYAIYMPLCRPLIETIAAAESTTWERSFWMTVSGLLEAQCALEQEHFVHQNLRPENVMVTESGKVVYIDLASVDQVPGTGKGSPLYNNSTAPYMASRKAFAMILLRHIEAIQAGVEESERGCFDELLGYLDSITYRGYRAGDDVYSLGVIMLCLALGMVNRDIYQHGGLDRKELEAMEVRCRTAEGFKELTQQEERHDWIANLQDDVIQMLNTSYQAMYKSRSYLAHLSHLSPAARVMIDRLLKAGEDHAADVDVHKLYEDAQKIYLGLTQTVSQGMSNSISVGELAAKAGTSGNPIAVDEGPELAVPRQGQTAGAQAATPASYLADTAHPTVTITWTMDVRDRNVVIVWVPKNTGEKPVPEELLEHVCGGCSYRVKGKYSSMRNHYCGLPTIFGSTILPCPHLRQTMEHVLATTGGSPAGPFFYDDDVSVLRNGVLVGLRPAPGAVVMEFMEHEVVYGRG